MGVLGGKVGRGMKRSVKRLSVCEENAQELDGSYLSLIHISEPTRRA